MRIHELLQACLRQVALSCDTRNLIESSGRGNIRIETGARCGYKIDGNGSARVLCGDTCVDLIDQGFAGRGEV